MKVVVQRVSGASVRINGDSVAKIGAGLLLLIGVDTNDTKEDVLWAADKCVNLRIFNDSEGKMNRSLLETGGSILAVSQFTLLEEIEFDGTFRTKSGKLSEKGKKLYNTFVEQLKSFNVTVECGVFGAMMEVELINDGPVTLLIDSR